MFFRVEKCVRKLEGVEEVSVNLLTNSMQVQYDETVLKEKGIIDAVIHAGYGVPRQMQNREKEKISMQVQDLQNRKKKSGAEAFGGDEEKNYLVFCFPIISSDVRCHGEYGRSSTAVLSFWNRKCRGICLYPVSHVSAWAVYKPGAYFSKGFSTLFHGAPNMDTLIAVGSGASLVYGIFAIYRMGHGLGVQDFSLVKPVSP